MDAMMKALLSHSRHSEMLTVYATFRALNDSASRTLARKACANAKCFADGRAITASLDVEGAIIASDSASNRSLLSTLINFYGERDKLERTSSCCRAPLAFTTACGGGRTTRRSTRC